ncbi:MAG: SDR family oxidoreductase [Acidobacteria bacterium]|nr:SDR family oxidoreductase [Acidobacteriota bacterium]
MIEPRKLFDLSGRVALITGASVGFGEAISLAFADYGCDVACSDLDLAATQKVADAIRAKGRRSLALTADTSKPEQITAMVNKAAQELGTIDILVNCAGIPQHNPAEDTPLEIWDKVLDINLRGTFLCCQAAARIMLPKKHGVIINFSSIAGFVGVGRGANAYCASKGGINTLTKQLALEWADRGIRVNAVAPCQFMTPGLKAVMAKPQFDPEKLMQTWQSNIPLGRVGQPEEIVGPVLFLASDASSMVTGVVLPVDGGYLAR